jgi:hypothetical protein
LSVNEAEGTLAYRWKADEHRFDMPIRIGTGGTWQVIQPTTDWKLMRWAGRTAEIEVATDLYYVNVEKY